MSSPASPPQSPQSPQSGWRRVVAGWRPLLTRRMGGPLGGHSLKPVGAWSYVLTSQSPSGAGTVIWRRPRPTAAWAYLLATVSWLVCMAHQLPCRQATPTSSVDTFGWMCYSDLTALYFTRGQDTGAVPYSSATWEYPVLTGYFATIANWLSKLFGAVLSPSANGQQLLDNGHIYFAISAIGLFACLIWTISSLLKLAPQMPVLAMGVAISPTLMANGLINWDLLVVALAVAGLAAWSRQRYAMAGIWWGLGVAAKLYPIVIIAALLIYCLRRDSKPRAWVSWLRMALCALVAWFIVNIPVMVFHFDGWEVFYVNNANRGADLGSLWYALNLSGVTSSHWDAWSRYVMVAGYLALAVLIFFARKAPSPTQIAYLAVVIMVVANVVYSPQYVLWILPLVMLVRPVALDITIFTISELFYYACIWLYLRQTMTLQDYSTPTLYIASIFIRVAATLWVVVRVVRDVLRQRCAGPVLADDDVHPRYRPLHRLGRPTPDRPAARPQTVPAAPAGPRVPGNPDSQRAARPDQPLPGTTTEAGQPRTTP